MCEKILAWRREPEAKVAQSADNPHWLSSSTSCGFGQYPFLGMVGPLCNGEIMCGFLECPTGPPRINVLSEPETRKRVDEARRAFHGTNDQTPRNSENTAVGLLRSHAGGL